MFRHKNREGFTLAEALLAVVLLSMAAAGVLLPFAGGAVVRAEGSRRTLASKVASDLMEEIINTPFDQIIASYGAYTETQGHIIKDFNAVTEFADPAYANFSRGASCENVYVPQQNGTVAANFIRVTVTVNYSGKEIVSVNRLISEW